MKPKDPVKMDIAQVVSRSNLDWLSNNKLLAFGIVVLIWSLYTTNIAFEAKDKAIQVQETEKKNQAETAKMWRELYYITNQRLDPKKHYDHDSQ